MPESDGSGTRWVGILDRSGQGDESELSRLVEHPADEPIVKIDGAAREFLDHVQDKRSKDRVPFSIREIPIVRDAMPGPATR